MKKVLFGYNIKDVNVTLDALREENESLNSTIITLKAQLKNSVTDSGVKASLLEVSLKENEENFKIINEEKKELTAKVSLLSKKTEELQQQNEELNRQIEHLHIQNEELTAQNDLIDNSAAAALESQLDAEKELRITLEEDLKARMEELAVTKNYINDYNALEERLTLTSSSLSEKNAELEAARREIEQLKEELAGAKVVMEEYAEMKANEKLRIDDMNHASEISLQARYNMSKMQKEVVEYVHEQMKEYYQLLNANSIKMRNAIEQRQLEYNKMIRDFFNESANFRVSLSSINDEYGSMTDFSINTDEISNRMKKIMDNFIEKTNSYSKTEQEDAVSEKKSAEEENSLADNVEELIKIPYVYKIPS